MVPSQEASLVGQCEKADAGQTRSWDDPICRIHHCYLLLSHMYRVLTHSIKSLHAEGCIGVTTCSCSCMNAFLRVGGGLSKKYCKHAPRITHMYVCSLFCTVSVNASVLCACMSWCVPIFYICISLRKIFFDSI